MKTAGKNNHTYFVTFSYRNVLGGIHATCATLFILIHFALIVVLSVNKILANFCEDISKIKVRTCFKSEKEVRRNGLLWDLKLLLIIFL